MTEARIVLLDAHHHLDDPDITATCISLPGAGICIEIRRDIAPECKSDLLALLDGLAPLLARLWANPERQGPMVHDLRAGALDEP